MSANATIPTVEITDGQVVYRCGGCGRENCKLWRDYQTFLNHQTLLCGECALDEQGKSGPIDADGYRTNDTVGHKTDQIGWRVPAVPTAEGDTFWGYTSVPADRVQWWRALPT